MEEGWLAVPGLVDAPWLDRLRAVTAEFVDASRTLTESNVLYDLDAGHSAEEPRLRRLSSPTDLHETYWEFASDSVITDVAVDLLGPDVKFHHSKLNFKAPRGGEEVKWHQDIQFWPHTNYDLLTIGVFLEDVEPGMGEVGFVPRSHDGELYDLYDGDAWVGALADDDVARAGVEAARHPVGPAGTITVHHCRTVHGSAPNRSDRARPLLLQTYAAADALSYTDLVKRSPHGEELIRGAPPRWARHDPRPCQLPPTGPYRPIFAVQQRERSQASAAGRRAADVRSVRDTDFTTHEDAGMTEISDRYRRLSEGFTARVAAVPADDARWSDQSPCTEWTARDVVAHMLDTHQLFFGLVDHEVPPGPRADDDPLAAWTYVRDAMQAALDDPEVAGREHEGMFGRQRWDASVDRFINTDVLLHTWDLARALGVDDRLDPDEVRKVYETAQGFGDAARGPQTFGPELPAPPDADEQDRLLAFVGRDPRA